MLIVAALSFNAPVMLLGLLAAGIPVVLHLLNKSRSPIVPFSTLRFLKITAMKTSRRRQLQHWLLLLLRMAVFALIAVSVAQPQIWGGSSATAYIMIVAFLAGIGLLALAILRLATGGHPILEHPPEEPAIVGQHAAPREKPPSMVTHWGTAAALLLAAVALLGLSVFGLGSDAFFSGAGQGYSGHSTAAVIILDNSHSMLARIDSASRLQRAKDQVRQLLLDTIRPAEAALLATNPGTIPPKDVLTTNMNEILGYVGQLQTVGRAKPMRDRLREAVRILAGTAQPNKMLIVISDMARQAFSDPEVFMPVRDVPDLQVVLMPQASGAPPADVGIMSFVVGQGQAVIGNELVFEAQVLNNADAADVRDLQLLVDDQLVPGVEPRVQLGPAGSNMGRASIKIPYRASKAGLHRFTLKLKNAGDAMAWDDQRDLVLNVADQVKVLVIGPEETLRSRSTAYFVTAALNPFAGGAPGTRSAWGVDPAYRGASAASDETLVKYAAVFVCDLPHVPAGLADSLLRYVNGGGRICWLLGPAVDGASYNQELGPRALLPGALSNPVVSSVGSTVDWVDTDTNIFANLFTSQEPFRQIVVTGRWGLVGNAPQRGRVLGKLVDGSAFITTHMVGDRNGEIYTLLTANTADWSNLGTTVTFLPMLVRIALGDLQHVKTALAADPGMAVDLAPPTQDRAVTLDVTAAEGGATINVTALLTDKQNPRWVFDRTYVTGLYTWRSVDGRFTGEFVINPPGEEVDLLPADAEALGREMKAKLPAVVAATASDLLTKLKKQSEATSLAPGVVAFVLMLAVLEALFANRYKPSVNLGQRHLAGVPVQARAA